MKNSSHGRRRFILGEATLCLLLVPSFAGCVYDYAALGARGADAAATGTGGAGGIGTLPVTGGGGGGQITAGSGGRGTGGSGSGTGGSGSGGRAAGTGGGGSGGGSVGTGGSGSGGSAPGTGGSGTGGRGTGGSGTGTGGGAGGSQLLALSIDFIGGRPPTTGVGGAGGAGGTTLIAAPAMLPSEIAGVKRTSQWNGVRGPVGSLGELMLSNGLVATTSVTWNSPPGTSGPGVWTLALADAAGDTRMLNGYLDPLTAATPATIVVSNLPPEIVTPGYDVYVYVTGDAPAATTRTYRYTIGAATQTVSQTGPPPTTFAGFTLAPAGGAGNYIVFRNVIGPSFTLTATPGTGAATRAPVNGIQIVAPTGS